LLAGCSSHPSDLAHTPVTIGPIPLAPMQETTKCVVKKLPSNSDVDIVEIDATLARGSHHLIVYKSSATEESGSPTGCTSFQGVLGGDQPILIAQSPVSVLTLPTGVAWHLPAGQMLLIEEHFLNASPDSIQGMGSVTFVPGAPGVSYQAADLMFLGSVSQLGGGGGLIGTCPAGRGLPPGQMTTLAPDFFDGEVNVDLTTLQFFAFTGHEHRHGTDVKIWQATASADPTKLTPIYESTQWDNAPLEVFDDAHLLSFSAGQGFLWQCSYDTTMETSNICFGESALTNEMCFFWAYYFPSVGHFVTGWR
jgi:hypothetical protein